MFMACLWQSTQDQGPQRTCQPSIALIPVCLSIDCNIVVTYIAICRQNVPGIQTCLVLQKWRSTSHGSRVVGAECNQAQPMNHPVTHIDRTKRHLDRTKDSVGPGRHTECPCSSGLCHKAPQPSKHDPEKTLTVIKHTVRYNVCQDVMLNTTAAADSQMVGLV